LKLTNTKKTSNTERERERERERDKEGVRERIMDINAGCKRVEFRLRTNVSRRKRPFLGE